MRFIARVATVTMTLSGVPAIAADAQVTAIRAGRIVDVTTAEFVGDQVIIVRGDRIEVGRALPTRRRRFRRARR